MVSLVFAKQSHPSRYKFAASGGYPATMRISNLPILLPWISALVAAGANNSSDTNGLQILNPDIDVFINNLLSEWNVPGGAAVAVVRLDEAGQWHTETKGYGIAKADGTKIDSNTIFSIGSNSKHFDVIATGLLITNESLTPQISWNTKIASILPDWKLMDPVASSESTITDLMSHRTGMPKHDVTFFVPNDTYPALLRRLQYLKPSTGFRDIFQYNNIMYSVLGYLPTALLPHRPTFAEYATKYILEPLGMNSSTYSFSEATATGRMADGFGRDGVNKTENLFGPGTPRAMPWQLNGETFSAVGGLLSTATDITRWMQMLLLNGVNPVTNIQVIPASVILTTATGVTVGEANAITPDLSAGVYGGGQLQYSYRGHGMWTSRLKKYVFIPRSFFQF
ncbi:beta-lactamase/transpeptidase-like protein [Mycena capillaripes]|nr:beta-lactamase/transpeptidase-like protein [Mycena capillaripes]